MRILFVDTDIICDPGAANWIRTGGVVGDAAAAGVGVGSGDGGAAPEKEF